MERPIFCHHSILSPHTPLWLSLCCRQLIHNIFEQYIKYYLFQQMTSKAPALTLTELLPRVAHLLTSCVLSKESPTRNPQASLGDLTEQLRTIDLHPQPILSALIGSPQAESRVRLALWQAMRVGKDPSVLQEKWSGVKQQSRQNYSIVESSINVLTKEVLENIKLIMEELKHLTHTIEELPLPNDPSLLPPTSLSLLLRLAMEDGNSSFPNSINQLIFRLYILEESTILVLLKAQRVVQQLSSKGNDDSDSRRSSVNTQRTGNTKRSALSESLAVFKRKQLREELQRSDLLPLPVGAVGKETQIQSDYKMSPRKNEKAVRGKNTATCCFRF